MRAETLRAFLVIGLFLAGARPAFALSYSTPDGAFAGQLATFSTIYAKTHGGRGPASWEDIQSMLTGPVDEAFKYILPTKRYAFLAHPIKLSRPYEGGELIILSRSPFRDSRLYTNWYGGISRGLREEAGRYMIFREPDGKYGWAYVPESYIAQIFQGSEALLPTPDRESERLWIASARREDVCRWIIPVVLLAGFGWFFWRGISKLFGTVRKT